MKPAPQLRGPLMGEVFESVRTQKAGRFWFSVPRPYVTHAPSDGRPARTEPVFIWHTPPEWLMPSETHERMTAMSSAISAWCGIQSLIHRPLLPCCFQVRWSGNIGALYSPIAVITGLKLSGSGFPAYLRMAGLGSNRSMWLGPPSMNRKMTLLARGA